MPFYANKTEAIQYDGTNSAAIVTFTGATIVSETGGTLRITKGGETAVIHTTDWITKTGATYYVGGDGIPDAMFQELFYLLP